VAGKHKVPAGVRAKKSKAAPKHSGAHHRSHTAKSVTADKANLVKARAVESSLARTGAQLAADRANLPHTRRTTTTVRQAAAEATYVARGTAVWHAAEAAYIAKGKAAWLRGEQKYKSHGRRGGVSLKPHALGVRVVVGSLKHALPKPHLLSKPVKFATVIAPTNNEGVASLTSWRRARQHKFKKRLYEKKMRRKSIGHWRMTRKRIRPY